MRSLPALALDHRKVLFELLRPLVRVLKRTLNNAPATESHNAFSSSASYWEARYAGGGKSGAGSYGHLAAYKAAIVNDFVEKNQITSVVEWGAGDGNQLTLLRLPQYIGIDVSSAAVRTLKARFAGDATKTFFMLTGAMPPVASDLALSMDVIYHLIEDDIFVEYMTMLFSSAQRYVIIYSSDSEFSDPAAHVRHRRFTTFVEENYPEWELIGVITNPHKPETPSDFYFYARKNDP